MFEPQNLPFQFQNYLREPQHLEHLRVNLQQVMHQDLSTLESLLTSVEATLGSQQIQEGDQVICDVRRKEREGQLFLLMAEQNRERSEKITSLVQLMTHLLDFIEEEQHINQELQEQYQRTIDHLNTTIDELRHSNKNVKSDVEIFREHLERAQWQIDELVYQKGADQEYQEGLLREGCLMKESRIVELEGELEELKDKIRSKILSKDMFEESPKDKALKYVYSQSRFFPISVLSDEYARLTKELENDKQSFQPQKKQKQQNNFEQQINQGEVLHKALQHVQSRRSLASLASTLQRENSGLLRFDNSSSNLHLNKLCYQLSHDQQQDFDILPRMPSFKTPAKLIYLEDDEDLHHDCSRHIFDRLCEKQSQTLPTPKNSENQTSTSYRSISPLTPRRSYIPPKFNKSGPKNSCDYDFSMRKSQSAIEPQSKGNSFYSSMFNFVVNRRIKRASQKAKEYCHKI